MLFLGTKRESGVLVRHDLEDVLVFMAAPASQCFPCSQVCTFEYTRRQAIVEVKALEVEAFPIVLVLAVLSNEPGGGGYYVFL